MSIPVQNGGSGYNPASPPKVTIDNPAGINDPNTTAILATATAVVSPFVFTGLMGGMGYTTPPTITITGGGASTEATAVPIMSNGVR